MVSLVIVSHSKTLAEGVKELALQMSQNKVKIVTAGGLDDTANPIGTDPAKIERAIHAAYTKEGVLVLMDIGSAIMSAEIAVEQLPKPMQERVILCEAPLVEGAIAAAAQAMAGASLKEVVREAKNAIYAKATLLQVEEESEQAFPAKYGSFPANGQTLEIKVPNELGLHARPAARLIGIVNNFEASVFVGTNNKLFVSAKSISQVSTLGAKKGDTLIFNINGKEADLVETALKEFAANNFGDSEKERVVTPKSSQPTKEITDKNVLLGIPASEGIAVGKAILIQQETPSVKRETVADTNTEISLLKAAIKRVTENLGRIKAKIRLELKKEKAQIFDFHLLLLADAGFQKAVIELIQTAQINAAFAWLENIRKLELKYLQMDTQYMRERATDILEVGNKVLLELLGKPPKSIELKEAGILVTDELGAAETVNLDLNLVKGIITRKGGETSHSAILARSLAIPAIVGLGDAISIIRQGEQLALDGQTGMIWLSKGNDKKIHQLRLLKEKQRKESIEIQAKSKASAITLDGRVYPILANVSSPKEAKIAFENGADGIGLYRTEFLYMNRKTPPTETEQYETYKAVCQNMKGLPVTMRTLDVGGDKPIPYLGIEKEKNPFLGLRGIRYCLHNTELFKTQLRAICRVSAEFPVRLMYPMIGVPEEVTAANELLKEVQADLQKEGIPFSKRMKVGIMIEVPSTIFCIPALAEKADFFSIGTNDLTQYLLALDRGNNSVAKYRNPLHPSVLQAIQEIITYSKEAHTEIGMCGELAGNPKATRLLMKMGLEKFSMSSPSIPKIKAIIREFDYSRLQLLPQVVSQMTTLKSVEQLAK